MKQGGNCWLVLLLGLAAIGACSSDPTSSPQSEGASLAGSGTAIDSNGDGIFDAADLDGDGLPDVFGTALDTNLDGTVDALDTNGDGAADYALVPASVGASSSAGAGGAAGSSSGLGTPMAGAGGAPPVMAMGGMAGMVAMGGAGGSAGTPAVDNGAPAGSPVALHGRLTATGNRIHDEHGEEVILRGVSLFWSQWQSETEGSYYNADVVSWLVSDWKIDIIRAAVGIAGDENGVNHPGEGEEPSGYIVAPEAEREQLFAVVDAALEAGIYVIIDWHSHAPYTEQAKAFFSEMAQTYGQHPNIIYEVFNEPWEDVYSWDQIKSHSDEVIAEIEAHDPNNLILVGSGRWSRLPGDAVANPVQGNVAYTVHFYSGSHQVDNPEDPHRWSSDAALAAGLPVFASEWGTSTATNQVQVFQTETEQWWDYMDENGISWCNWSIIDKDEANAALVPGASAMGGWTDAELTESGRLVREKLRSYKP